MADKNDRVQRGSKQINHLGTALYFGLRSLDPLLQYSILKNDVGSSLIHRLGGTTLPRGPPLVTNTPLDHVVGLSPYRSILLAMNVLGVLKQNYWLLAIGQEEVPPAAGIAIGVTNLIINGISSLLFVCSQTSASVNGEHFPQSPLIFGSTIFALGIFLEWFSEVQRASWKKDPANKGKVYDRGLFGLSRHVNYFGFALWRAGYACAAGGWLWGATLACLFTFDFTQNAIPMHEKYMREKVSPHPNARVAFVGVKEASTDFCCSTVNSTSSTSRRCRTNSSRLCGS